jgi:hypothetical protein
MSTETAVTEATSAITIEQYYDDLNGHDWYCGFSDDYEVEKRGTEDRRRLHKIAIDRGHAYQALFDAFGRHYFSGTPWGTPRWDKPARPVDGVVMLPPAPAKEIESPVAVQQQESLTPVAADAALELDEPPVSADDDDDQRPEDPPVTPSVVKKQQPRMSAVSSRVQNIVDGFVWAVCSSLFVMLA